jgi:hypothetical protein
MGTLLSHDLSRDLSSFSRALSILSSDFSLYRWSMLSSLNIRDWLTTLSAFLTLSLSFSIIIPWLSWSAAIMSSWDLSSLITYCCSLIKLSLLSTCKWSLWFSSTSSWNIWSFSYVAFAMVEIVFWHSDCILRNSSSVRLSCPVV